MKTVRVAQVKSIKNAVRRIMKNPAVYIVTNKKNGTLYTGVTSDLPRRIYEHKQKIAAGFTKKYNCTQLVFYEMYDFIDQAIVREKQIKNYPRSRKIYLINSMNPEWNDLYDGLT